MNFNEKVWKMISKIPRGKVTTYKQIASALNNSGAARAVGNACNANPNAPRVPCHRVITSSGFVGGYNNGIEKKTSLLKSEGITISKTGNIDLKEYLYRFKK